MLSLDALSTVQMRLATGLTPELERCPRPRSRNRVRGPTCKGKGAWEGKREEMKRKGRGGQAAGIICLLFT